jgi:hypothetical protein
MTGYSEGYSRRDDTKASALADGAVITVLDGALDGVLTRGYSRGYSIRYSRGHKVGPAHIGSPTGVVTDRSCKQTNTRTGARSSARNRHPRVL